MQITSVKLFQFWEDSLLEKTALWKCLERMGKKPIRSVNLLLMDRA